MQSMISKRNAGHEESQSTNLSDGGLSQEDQLDAAARLRGFRHLITVFLSSKFSLKYLSINKLCCSLARQIDVWLIIQVREWVEDVGDERQAERL